MAEKYSLIVLSGSGKLIKRAHCSHWRLYGVFGALFLLLLIIVIGATDYIRIYQKDLNNDVLEAELALQTQEVAHHRKQIQKFAREINQLKNRIVEINHMDQLIRRIADLEENNALFGIGGSAPDDLKPDLAPERKYTQLIRAMHHQVDQLESAAAHQQNSLGDLLKVVKTRGNIAAYTPTIRPAEGLISSRFGYRVSPFTGRREFHNGLDIANHHNTEIIATANGRIAFSGERRGYGRLVVIDHGHGLTTRYAHLEQIFRKRDDVVKRGEVIACMGNSGRSTGTHLHYEVRLNGVPINPQKYILNGSSAQMVFD
jgi:murein DD-endopeptidase MepM/ murein hydrolase activator NlpD